MPSERVQRRIDRLLDQAEEAADQADWTQLADFARRALALDPENSDARSFLSMAELEAGDVTPAESPSAVPKPAQLEQPSGANSAAHDGPSTPYSFANGRYSVTKFLGEGGKKKVYRAHDNTLDRDVAFALIKTEGLDETSRERVKREAQAMGRMGTHPQIMPIYDLGEEPVGNITQPYMVQPLMGGGDVEGLIDSAAGPLELERAVEIATQTAQGLSFAHGKGIVHRDLKPGNVWLDEDGAAKIGDFGLAVATDRSRLTIEKVMVGTVSYMPPEQATGGEVTPRADLYSLGAMLYEMCTGRVPFMGDDDIAVISQHINTPPVAPSWHNPQIPKTLDALILRMMSKDPAERPASADEVLAALQAVDLSVVEESDEKGAGSLDSMAGGVFVGRQREMDQLKATFEEVLSGRGRMVTLVGEPGIGKTRTAQELATYAGMRGAATLWGRSYESGGAPPYWPWVQAIRTHVSATEPQQLRNQLGSAGPVIAEVVSDIREKLPDLPEPTRIEDPESARFRLFDSISTFLKQASQNAPLVLMLEDLHWADKPSLMLLEFVARELANSKLMIVGNYRDVDLNRRHPLSVTLGDLTRERLFERVVLRGLQRHDVQRFIEIAAGINPPAALVDTVHSQTEGNPLFVTETVRLLIQEGDIASGRETSAGTTSWEIRIPEGVREVIGRRLDRLSERCNEVLTIGAVVGRQFRFDVLKMLVEDTSENQLLDAMDEALSARIIEELPEEVGLYQFTHASMQETLTSELSANRTVRMHAQIAEALEEYWGDEVEEHAAELAHHFEEAEIVIANERIVPHLVAAGNKALERFDYADAVRYLQRALTLNGRDKRDFETAELLSSLSVAQSFMLPRHQQQITIDTRVKAFRLFVELNLVDRAIATATLFFPSIHGPTGLVPILRQAIGMVDSGSREEGYLQALFCQRVSIETGAYKEALDARDRAIEISKKLADQNIELAARTRMLSVHSWHGREEDRVQEVRDGIPLLKSTGLPALEVEMHQYASEILGKDGDEAGSAAHLAESSRLALRLRSTDLVIQALLVQCDNHVAVGDWTRARSDLGQAFAYDPVEPRVLAKAVALETLSGDHAKARRYIDKSLDFADSLKIGEDPQRVFYSYAHRPILIYAQITGEPYRIEKAQEFGRILAGLESVEPIALIEGQRAVLVANIYLETDQDLARQHTQALRGLEPSDPLELAPSALKAGDYQLAIEQYHLLMDVQSRPIRALVFCGLAESLLARDAPGDREKAIELQDEAINITTDLGMKPLLERLLAKRDILKA